MGSNELGFGKISDQDEYTVRQILLQMKVVAIVGLSTNPERPSYEVAQFLQSKGYKIIPIRPGGNEILGQKCYARLEDLEEPVDVVDIFRRAEECPEIVESAIKIHPKAIWLQEGIVSEKSKKLAEESNILFIMNYCLKKAYQKYKK